MSILDKGMKKNRVSEGSWLTYQFRQVEALTLFFLYFFPNGTDVLPSKWFFSRTHNERIPILTLNIWTKNRDFLG